MKEKKDIKKENPVKPVTKEQVMLPPDVFNAIWAVFVQFKVRDVIAMIDPVRKIPKVPEGYLIDVKLLSTLYELFSANLTYREGAPVLRTIERIVGNYEENLKKEKETDKKS